MLRIIHVFGLSGVGKTWLCGRYASRHDVVHASASGLMRAAKEEAGEATDSNGLRTGPVLDNQSLLIRQFQKLRTEVAETTRAIVLDAHNVIDGRDGLVEIPLAVIRDLNPDAIVFVRADPIEIYERRASDESRERPERDVRTLEHHQDAALALAYSYATALSVPFHTVAAGDEAAFASALDL